jgi:hypothetical protein
LVAHGNLLFLFKNFDRTAKAMSMKRFISAAHGFRQTKVRTYLGAHPFKAAGPAWEG